MRVSGLEDNVSELLMNEGAGILKIEGSVVMGVTVGVGADVVGATVEDGARVVGITEAGGASMVGVDEAVGADMRGATDVGVAVGSGVARGMGAGIVGATLSFMGRVRGLG